jgi:NADPH:quinone reductase-like Zn-dependent oxidoreductase
MRAIVQTGFGDPAAVLALSEQGRPEPAAHEVLVRVRASSVNAGDWMRIVGRPYVLRPTFGVRGGTAAIPGKDIAGTVEAVGSSVTELIPGDEVYGELPRGAYAEYVAVDSRLLARAPKALPPAEAATVPLAGVTALQGLRDAGGVRAGHRVLVIGASGGVGTFAVQIASAMGADVTGVCSTRNVGMVQALGAADTVDYTREDFTTSDRQYDVILDLIGAHKLRTYRRLLAPEGVYVAASGRPGGATLGPLPYVLRAGIASLRRGGPLVKLLVAKPSADDLAALSSLIDAGSIAPVIDRTYDLAQVADAIAYQGAGHTQGKTAINI